MFDLKEINNYLPVITVFLTAFLGYIFGNRHYKNERLYKNMEDILENFYSPAYHEMKNIKLNMTSYNKFELIENFSKKYLSTETKIFKSYNNRIVQMIDELQDIIIEYKKSDERELITDLSKKFDGIYYCVQKDYNDIRKSLYKEMPWCIKLNSMNPILKLLMELIDLFYDIMKFLLICWLILSYTIIVNRIKGNTQLPSIIKDNISFMSFIIITLFFMAIVFRLPHMTVSQDYKAENKFSKKFSKWCIERKKKFSQRKKSKSNDLKGNLTHS